NSGYFGLTVTRSGSFSGRLLSAGRHSGFTGRLNLAGDAMVKIRRGMATPVSVAIHVNLTNRNDQVTGSVTDGTWTSAIAGDRNVFSPTLNPAQQAGLRS